MILSLNDLSERLTQNEGAEGLNLDLSSDSDDGLKQIWLRTDGEQRLRRLVTVELDEDGDVIFVVAP